MSDKMRPVEFGSLISRILSEFKNENSVFGIHSQKFFRCRSAEDAPPIKMSGGLIETLFGPAAGPHTQLAQNIISAYVTGSRFFELKTVQKMDELTIDKPCIDATDEAYNVEWSQELKLTESFDEYLKAWMIMNVLQRMLGLSDRHERAFVFNMSVGYNLEGIRSETVDRFINCMKDACNSDLFEIYKKTLKGKLQNPGLDYLIDSISPFLSDSVTLSTMHGCPPEDIEAIAKYLMAEKGLNTHVKLNPTLLGFDKVRDTLSQSGFSYIELDRSSFTHDLKMQDAIPMLTRLISFAKEHKRSFGIKLSNTLGVNNTQKKLPGDQMYMSGRPLFPLTITLADTLAREFNGSLPISFSGGASAFNIKEILETGIYPVTLVTDILKPGGYERLYHIAEHLKDCRPPESIDMDKLHLLAESSRKNIHYTKGSGRTQPYTLKKELPVFDCYIAPCTHACPAGQNIPGYIRLTELGKYEEAFALIMQTNPLPNITGYICDHKCMTACTRLDYDRAVEIREIKKDAAIKGYAAYSNNSDMVELGANSPKAAVIGAGPSGLSAAYYLRREGFDVTVFEKNEHAGGTVQDTIPDFRLPQEAIHNDVKLIEKSGVKFRFGVSGNFSVQNLKDEGYKYIYISIGAMLPNGFSIPGDSSKVYDALEFLRSFRQNAPEAPGKTAAVIGGGNSAMDAARAALRLKGIEKVYIIYRRTKEFMPADQEEFDNAVSEGAVFRELLLPEEFTGTIIRCRKMKLSDYDESGRRRVIPTEEFEDIRADWIISAIGEHTDFDVLKANSIMGHNDKSIKTNTVNETRIENVFIGGDALRGPSTVIEAAADGRKAAEAIAIKEFGKLKSEKSAAAPLSDETEAGIIEKKADVQANFQQRHECLSHLCLSCDLLCNKCVEVCPNRANVAVNSSSISGELKDKYQIIHLDAFCNECGNCATFCPYEGKPYKDKITLFLNEVDLNESTNNGFTYGLISEAGKIVKYRMNGKCGEAVLNEEGNFVNAVQAEGDLKKLFEVIQGINKYYGYLVR